MLWTITESKTPHAPVRPPEEPVAWKDMPVGAWVYLVSQDKYAYKVGPACARMGEEWTGPLSTTPCILCPPDWRFEARVVDGTLRFVPLVEVEREEFDIIDTDNIGTGELVKGENGAWFVGHCTVSPVPLTDSGRSRRFRRPRGPVTLTYTPPTE